MEGEKGIVMEYMTQRQIEKAVCGWMPECTFFPEFSFHRNDKPGHDRIDMVFVVDSTQGAFRFGPNGKDFWSDRHGLIGVEIKSSREDFLRGMRENQLQRYQEHVNGVLLATTPGVCRKNELPKGVGLLICRKKNQNINVSCMKKPVFEKRDYQSFIHWKIAHKYRELLDAQKREFVQNEKRIKKKVTSIALGKIERVLKNEFEILDKD